jgi:hypothetical protein
VWDDASSVLIHQDVQDPARVAELFKKDQHAYGRGQGNFYRPLVSLSFMIDYALAGGEAQSVSPFLFHVANLFWHALAAVLLMVLLQQLGAAVPVAAAVATVYAVHPLHTEAVTYISGRADSMAAAFMFAALALALWKPYGGPKWTVAVVASGVLFAAALLSKESALIYTPLLVLCAMASPDGKKGVVERIRVRLVPIGLGVVVTVVYALLRSSVLSFGSDSAPRTISFAERMGEVFGAFAIYLKLVFVPTGLHMERVLDDQPLWQVVAGIVLLAAVLGGAVVAARAGRRRIAGGLGWFVLTWLPISGIFPLNAPMAEHWLYVPLAGLLWAFGEVVWLFARRGVPARVATVAVAVIVLVFIAMSVDRNRDWQDNESIYTATLKYNPDTIRVNYNLAVTYEDIVGNPAGAQRHFRRVVDLYQAKREAEGTPEGVFWADELDARLSLGRLYLADADFARAQNQFTSLMNDAVAVGSNDIAGKALMGIAICNIAFGQSAQSYNIIDQIAKNNQLESASIYFRRTYAENRRISDQLQAILMRVAATRQAEETGAQPDVQG